MDLIDEKNGLLPIHTKRLLRLGHHLFHVLFPATVALICVKRALVVLAITLASVVFPVPGGP